MIQASYDLHLHSCLSPCGDDASTPAAIAGYAALNGLQVIALTDHNSCKNCGAFLKACDFYGIVGIPGMELTTSEEVHVVCLFSALSDAMRFDGYVYEHLLDIKNDEKIFGKQQIMNEEDEELGRVEKLLISATDIDFDDVFDLVTSFNGIMIPAHLDKKTTSLISQLGFVPPDSRFRTAELKNMANLHNLRKTNPYLEGCRIITSSDAHYLKDINMPVNTILVEELTPAGVIAALS
ncbi:MAG: PHP domain-containing protein [Lachnospiraceae bacterium]|nr:PHP domain-containing protein [Lachnospiraceae bacterium]